MSYEEFNEISGCKCDPMMYKNEIEPTYMFFDDITKQEISMMYWGTKKDTYRAWMYLNNARKTLEGLKKFTSTEEIILAGKMVEEAMKIVRKYRKSK